jgi:assimilatory nitrate reductase catalytic subunit
MTRSGKSAKLATHRPEPFLEIDPLDAKAHGLRAGGYARVRSAHGACVLKVVTSAGQQRGCVFAPIHWSNANAASARVSDLVSPQTDPYSGQPEAKATPVSVEPLALAYRGFAIARRTLRFSTGTVWSQLALPGATGFTFAGNDTPAAWHELAPSLFPDAVLTEYSDRGRGLYRAAAFVGGRLEGALFVGPAEEPPQWSELRELNGAGVLVQAVPALCACFSVGVAAIHEALASGRAASVEEIGRALRAGEKCGTCLPELRSLVDRHRRAAEQGAAQPDAEEPGHAAHNPAHAH